MNYTVIDDPAWVATRARMHVEFRIELDRIVTTYPDTHAADEAGYLLIMHDVPELSAEAARDRVERAARMLGAAGRPAELYEAWMLLVEVRDGYYDSDEVSTRAEELLSTLRKDRSKEFAAAETEARALRAEADILQTHVRGEGSLLSRKKADEIMVRLKDVAKRSGGDTVLAGRITAYIEELAESFEGTPLVGVRLDYRFPGPGVRIVRVDSGTGAAKAGLLSGDIVLRIAKTALAGPNDLSKALTGKKPGETVKIEVRRASGEIEALDLPLGRRLRTRQSHFPR
jgi:PDZ domain